MTAHSDDVKIQELLAPLSRLEPVPFRGLASRNRRWFRRPVVVGAVVAAALALTGVAIADGFGAFNGIGAAQHPRTGADVIDAQALASLQEGCPSEIVNGSFYMPFCHLVLDSARLIGDLPSYGKVYVVADTRGDLCSVIDGSGADCVPPLTSSRPISIEFLNDSPTSGGTFVADGIATDGVESVSFNVNGKPVTVPVKNNIWVYEETDSHATTGTCIVAHMADGSTVKPLPIDPCP